MADATNKDLRTRRIERCESWIAQAITHEGNVDVAFICWWIAFNSLYGDDNENPEKPEERKRQQDFFKKIVSRDGENRIYNAIFGLEMYSDSINTLITNEYAFDLFWLSKNAKRKINWKREFAKRQSEYEKAFDGKKTERILWHLFSRLYVLRNQIMHGGATWNSRRNRDSVGDGWEILKFLVPVFLDIIKTNSDMELGKPYYYADDV